MVNLRKRVKPSSDDDEDVWSANVSTKKKQHAKKRKTLSRKVQTPDSKKPEVENTPTTLLVNTSGLATFPDELLLELMAHFPAVPLPDARSSSYYSQAHVERREALLSLSQSCSNLRRFFRPYVWQRIDVVSGMRFPQGGYYPSNRVFNLELIRQLEIVTIRDPSLAEYVQVINVEVTKYSGDAVLEELARCMTLFPQLHTVKLLTLNDSKWTWNITAASNKAFSKYSYPQVRTVIVAPATPNALIRSCPRARKSYSY
ncbi:hypothetical protein GALMADRAFT_231053 [Galerina marginata CBS 339.88]|uniref:F-box domain-containing protein n=1 Tax=Galerina marginata (strain CBS 339.88) TaxID=685588 RepID=A0A067SFD2_GALM3|nr:hypothetical protein GALMADRAFT_231053 [Galerina marginata CBS 339.88]